MSRLTPVVLFVYNRAEHASRTLEALASCPEARRSDLFIYCDGPRNDSVRATVEATRRVARSASGFQSVRICEREENVGVFKNVVAGVNEVLDLYDRAIVLEDDIEVTPGFLAYMNAALDHYSSEQDVFSVTGYLYPVELNSSFPYDTFLFPRFCCWGWATWRDRWQRISWTRPDQGSFFRSRKEFWRFWRASNDLPEILLDLIGAKNDSWSILFNHAQIHEGGYCVYPTRSRVRNSGFDGTGTHAGHDSKFETETLKSDVSAGSQPLRFAGSFDSAYAEPLRRFFANSFRRRVRNLIRYGRFF
jgi:hypothetical protein